jgi:hypothetical protein
MSNKKIYLLILLLIIAIVVVVVVCRYARGLPENTNTNSSILGLYKNSNFGLSFEYPKTYGKAIEEPLSPDIYDWVWSGKGLRISFNGIGNPFFTLISKDYSAFKENYYHGSEDIKKLCPQIGVYDAKDMSLCKSINIAGQEAFERYFVVADEGVAFVNRAVYLNLSGTDYTGLTVSQIYPNLAVPLNDLLSAENEKEFAAQAESMINDLSRKENLPTPVGEQVDDFEQMLNTLKVV